MESPHREESGKLRRIRCAAGLGLLILVASQLFSAPGATVSVLTVKGAIGPATTDYLKRGIESAAEAGDAAVVIRLDTPGGLDAATRDINQAILAASIPVLSYVHPEGARAASAGTYILYASHIAAMAPATSTGAATPVPIMSPTQPDGRKEQGKDQSEEGDEEDDVSSDSSPSANASTRKAVNDSVAYIRGLAEKRGRNADWAERAVRDAASVSASEALAQGVIDIVATDINDLLSQANGMEVELPTGMHVLATSGATVRTIEPDWRNNILARITDPTVAYLLFLIGIYGLLLEGYNPGVFLPGIVGAICLTLALYAFQVLPINYAGVLLMALGVALLAAEAFAPSFGILGIGGLVALSFGSLILIDEDVADITVSRAVITALGTLSGLAFLGVSVMVARSRRQPVVSGADRMVGQRAEVMDEEGRVHVVGEAWFTRCESALEPGDTVEVVGLDGLTLVVRKLSQQSEDGYD